MYHKFIPYNSFHSIQIWVENQSLNKRGQNRVAQMFQYEVQPPSARRHALAAIIITINGNNYLYACFVL